MGGTVKSVPLAYGPWKGSLNINLASCEWRPPICLAHLAHFFPRLSLPFRMWRHGSHLPRRCFCAWVCKHERDRHRERKREREREREKEWGRFCVPWPLFSPFSQTSKRDGYDSSGQNKPALSQRRKAALVKSAWHVKRADGQLFTRAQPSQGEVRGSEDLRAAPQVPDHRP